MENSAESNQEINRIIAKNLLAKDTAALDYMMSSPDGRWFISRLLDNCHVNSMLGIAHPDGRIGVDENIMLIQEGERRVGIMLRRNILSLANGLELLHTMECEKLAHQKQLEEIRRSAVESDN